MDDWDLGRDDLHINEEERDTWVSFTAEFVVSAAEDRI